MEKEIEQFEQWMSLFPARLFAMIIAHIDESGTHDSTGVQAGASHATIGGYVGYQEDWVQFQAAWKSMRPVCAAPRALWICL